MRVQINLPMENLGAEFTTWISTVTSECLPLQFNVVSKFNALCVKVQVISMGRSVFHILGLPADLNLNLQVYTRPHVFSGEVLGVDCVLDRMEHGNLESPRRPYIFLQAREKRMTSVSSCRRL